MRIGVLFILLLSSWSCSSVPEKKNIILPATVESLFATCASGDGALNVQIYEQGNLRGSGDLEWIADFQEGWKSDLINPVGRSLLKLGFNKRLNLFEAEGMLTTQIPPLGIEDGFVTVDGYFAGIMPDEIPCFLKFRLPRSWLQNVVSFEQKPDRLLIGFVDDERAIRTEVVGKQPELTSEICSTISWSAMWGLSTRSLIICNKMTGAKSGSLKGLEDFSVRWIDIDG